SMHDAAFQSIPAPSRARIVGDEQRLFMHAAVEPSRVAGVEGDAPHVGAGKSRVARLPRLAAIVADEHSDAPSGERDTLRAAGVKGDVVEVAINSGASEILETPPAVARNEHAATLRGRQPEAGVVRRLLEPEHLESGRT